MIRRDNFLTKLKIEAYVDREMRESVGSITAMYNPDALQLNYQTDYTPTEFINSDVQSNYYQLAHPGKLDLELIFDARMPESSTSIERQLAELKFFCCTVNAESNEPHFLAVSWGKLSMGAGTLRNFAGRAINFTVNYSSFDRDGTPLRATVRLALVEDSSLLLQKAQQSLQAPMTKMMAVTDGASLPMVAANSKGNYLTLAKNNGLDSLRAIEPGQILVAHRQE
jgi:hypothetical protein